MTVTDTAGAVLHGWILYT